MKRILLLLALLLALLTPGVQAQSGDGYDLTWWTVDGGGDALEADGLALMGTVGQPDTGPALTGGGFTLTGGFWPGSLALSHHVYLPMVLRNR
jgi:hypothetical protein